MKPQTLSAAFEALLDKMPDQQVALVFTAQPGKDTQLQYISNCDRSDAIAVTKEWLLKQDELENWAREQDNPRDRATRFAEALRYLLPDIEDGPPRSVAATRIIAALRIVAQLLASDDLADSELSAFHLLVNTMLCEPKQKAWQDLILELTA